MTTFLSRDQIIECTGVQQFENLIELEILFNSFDEFANLEGCTHLRRLSCIDNGLKRISNLQPLGMTLTTLCLCDQGLTAMDNLALPNLRELFLHRNAITRIGNLSGCPRLRKLWLFQNKIETAAGLHAVPELEECWLQANSISKLHGFETLNQLQNLGLAGNQIVDFKELKRFSVCTALRAVSFSDIHFGRCPIADEAGYQEFVVLHLPQVTVLDGIGITKEIQLSAEDIFYSQLKSFNSSLLEVEDSYQQSLRNIEAQYQSRESYSNVLEKEMSAALKELQGLVSEGRGVIAHQVGRSQQLVTSNSRTVTTALEELELQAKIALRDQLDLVHQEFDIASSLLSVLEQVALADSEVVSVLCDAQAATATGAETTKKGVAKAAAPPAPRKVLFQAISNNTADFQMLSQFITPPTPGEMAGNNKKKAGRNAAAPVNIEGDYKSIRGNLDRLEVARLYKVALSPLLGYSAASNNPTAGSDAVSSASSAPAPSSVGQAFENSAYQRVFTLLTPEQMRAVLVGGWEALQMSPVFSPDADVVATLYGTVGVNMTQTLPEEYTSVLQADGIDDNALLHLKHGLDGGGNGGGGGKGGKKGGASGTSNAAKLVRLQTALGSKLFLLICCKLYADKVSFGLLGEGSTVSNMQLPASEDQRRQLMGEFQKSRRPQKVNVQLKSALDSTGLTAIDGAGSAGGAMKSASLVYLIPPRLCTDAVGLDFAALCVSPPVDGGGLRSIDSRLEPLLVPTNNVEHSAHILSTFEKKAAEQVRHYCDKLLEEVDEATAAALRQAEGDVLYREGSLKTLREEVEKERRGQDALLRDMRQLALNADTGSSGNGSPIGGMAPSFSNANMPGSGVKPSVNKNSKR